MKPPRISCRRYGSPAFSLLELLAAIGIISVLAVTLFSVGGSVRNQAKGAQCLGNMRTLYSAISAYKQDGGSWLSLNRNDPNNASSYGTQLWFITLMRLGYVDWVLASKGGKTCMYARAMVCPANRDDPGAPYLYSSDVNPPWRTNYAMSYYWGDSFGQPSAIPGQYGRIPALGATNLSAILLIDSLTATGGIYPDKQADWNSSSCKIPRMLHGSGCHALLANGSVITVSPQTHPDLPTRKYWDPIQQ